MDEVRVIIARAAIRICRDPRTTLVVLLLMMVAHQRPRTVSDSSSSSAGAAPGGSAGTGRDAAPPPRRMHGHAEHALYVDIAIPLVVAGQQCLDGVKWSAVGKEQVTQPSHNAVLYHEMTSDTHEWSVQGNFVGNMFRRVVRVQNHHAAPVSHQILDSARHFR
jgi:hypothetical protein